MKKNKNFYKFIFTLVIFFVSITLIYVLFKGYLYEKDFTMSPTVDLKNGWSIENEGELYDIDFPLNIIIDQKETIKLFYTIGGEFDDFKFLQLIFISIMLKY